MKRALIIGISGQDGTLLADLLLKKRYIVYGSSRDTELNSFRGLTLLGIKQKINFISLSLVDFRSVLQVIDDIKPDEIYNLSGQTSVSLSFVQPIETFESISLGTLNILEVLRYLKKDIRFYNACSSECFGFTDTPANEKSPFNPLSPYAVAKATAFWLVSNYRNAYNLYACSGLLSNHESFLRSNRFVTRKIIDAVINIKNGSTDKLELGNLSIIRDWGCAEEYVNAMYLMLQQDQPDDYIIATGKSISLEEFVEYCFAKFGLDYKNHISKNERLVRPSDISQSYLSPAKAKKQLGWAAHKNVYDVIDSMLVNVENMNHGK
jgi:GDPmannose 4,6-dehydratase